jgi:hypothetical protein
MDGESQLDGELDDLFVEDRKRPRQTHAGGAGMAIRLSPELRRTAAEYLALRKKMGMDLEAHYPS